MTGYDKYRSVLTTLAERGYTDRASLGAIKNAILAHFTIHQDSVFKFHIQNMEGLGLIKQSNVANVWEIANANETVPSA